MSRTVTIVGREISLRIIFGYTMLLAGTMVLLSAIVQTFLIPAVTLLSVSGLFFGLGGFFILVRKYHRLANISIGIAGVGLILLMASLLYLFAVHKHKIIDSKQKTLHTKVKGFLLFDC